MKIYSDNTVIHKTNINDYLMAKKITPPEVAVDKG
jgi:hypothetical protein